jgi:hypothetical protein
LGRFARAALAAALLTAAAVGVARHLRTPPAQACAWFGPTMAEVTTFDPQLLGEGAPEALTYHDQEGAIGFGACDDCGAKAMAADWRGYLGGAVSDADWAQVLHQATAAELAAIDGVLAGKRTTVPAGYEHSTLWQDPKARDRLRSAIAVVELARRGEGTLTLERPQPAADAATPADAGVGAGLTGPTAALVAEATTRARSARDPFLKQRYGFIALRYLFYRRDWSAVTAYHEANAATLGAPSSDLAWRARYYAAGAYARQGEHARANLELARIHVGSPALAGAALDDFHPREDADWRAALRLAKDPRDQALLWSLVGIKTDGLAALQEILKLDPRSPACALLVVRELTRAEAAALDDWGQQPDPKAAAARAKAFATLEGIALRLAATPGADRPWLMELVAGHLAAKRGDLAAARPRLLHAAASHPDVRVASQAKASLALALAVDWKINPGREDELATAMAGLDASFGRTEAVRGAVRGSLAAVYAKAGRLVDAEFLVPGTVDPLDPATGRPFAAPSASRWADPTFLKAMIARTSQTATAFDRFVVGGSFTRNHLEAELGLNALVRGDLAGAARTFRDTTATSAPLGTDPFVIHVVDCHDCDHERYAKAPWTHASFATRLAALAQTGKGEAAAAAALSLGNALYNITWYGNARVVLAESHQAATAGLAARWYQRAFALTTNRELKAKAAFLAAKCELATKLDDAEAHRDPAADPGDGGLPVPTTWFPVVKRYADTRYYQEILAECGHFKAWAKATP